MGKLIITPKTKVGEMLDAYPALEDVLLSISPVFSKLKNPVLRRTVARVATLQQVAVIGNMPVEVLVNRLRAGTGQEGLPVQGAPASYTGSIQPEWFSEELITDIFDATNMINAGDSPMKEVFHRAENLHRGAILKLQTPFVPAPVIDLLIQKGYLVWTNQSESKTDTYIYSG